MHLQFWCQGRRFRKGVLHNTFACLHSIYMCVIIVYSVIFYADIVTHNSFYYIAIIAIKSTHFLFGNWFLDQSNTTLSDSQGIQYSALQVAPSI